jgi:putative ABC transport system ATP-binding protein
MDDRKVVIELQDVKRDFLVGEETVHALRGVSFKIYEGEFVTIMGKSGSGKSTLLNQLGCLDTPTSGEYLLDGVAVRSMSKSQRAVLRNRKIGFIFQNYNLLPKTTSVENVALPLMYNSEVGADERKDRAIKALQAVGLGERLYRRLRGLGDVQSREVGARGALGVSRNCAEVPVQRAAAVFLRLEEDVQRLCGEREVLGVHCSVPFCVVFH